MPTKIGKYTILNVAGRGNVGVVYVGHDPFSDSHVAIKVCAIDDGAGGGTGRLFRKMFFNEAHTAGSLDNPNILKIFDAGEEDGQPYIVMEYVSSGLTLKDYCAPDKLLPIEKAVQIGFKCAKALDYAHRRGVVHRDIKPTNIMLTDDDDVKIGDFGIAQQAQADITQVMGIIGSPLYMSPEQASEEELNNQTDIYSLGAVLFELLTGRPPFLPAPLTRLIFQLLNETPPMVPSLRVEAPQQLGAVIAKALEKDRSKRYKTGLEFAMELARVASHLNESPEIAEDDKFSSVRELRFFQEFSDAEIWEVVRATRWLSAVADDTIIWERDTDQSFYIIVEGSAAVLKDDNRIVTLGRGECFGEMAYLTNMRRTATVRAAEDMTLMQISAALLERVSVTCQLRFNKVFLQTLIERLARTSDDLSKARNLK